MSFRTTKVQILRDFKKSLIDFLDNLIEIFPSERQLILYRITLKEIPTTDIINHFIQHILPYKDMVKNRNDDFFIKTNLLKSVDEGGVNYMKNIWLSRSLEDDDKSKIWKWMDKFIRYLDMYLSVENQN